MMIICAGYLALREVLQEVILHDCLLDDGAGPEVLVVLGDVDVPGHGYTLTRHALLLHQGCGGQRSIGLLQNKKYFMTSNFLKNDNFLRILRRVKPVKYSKSVSAFILVSKRYYICILYKDFLYCLLYHLHTIK